MTDRQMRGDCCTCAAKDFDLMQQEVRAFYGGDFVSLIVCDDPFSMALKIETSCMERDLFNRNMVKIAIWPYTMDEDDIVCDPTTGQLTPETLQRVSHYLRLTRNQSMSLTHGGSLYDLDS